MVYYILGKNEDKENLMFSTNILGEESFGSFYPEQGFIALHNIIHTKPEKINDFSIIDEQGKKYSVTEFLDVVEKLKIMSKST
jgi:hypothetical protein|tara:strand:+ start:510 stop:758 length:249 start_codon:yes stop_codon:yes gene_type:complete